jgi:uncharacterized membrane protein
LGVVEGSRVTVLEVGPDGPLWAHYGADALLFLHIGGGSLAMAAGAAALLSRKGASLHRAAGTVFFVSMLVAAGIGGAVAPFLSDGQRPNTVAGILAFYLVASAWAAVRREDVGAGRLVVAGFAVALCAAAAGIVFMLQAANSPMGTVDGSPPQAFYLFAIVGGFAAAGDLNVILRGGLSGAPRIARHLWRMCTGLFIAAGSFFLGQQQVMPAFMRGSPLLFVPVFLPLAFLLFWLVRVRLTNWYNRGDARDTNNSM